MSVFEKLSPDARKSINYAFEEAKILNSKYIGMEHILLGIFRNEKSIVYKKLSKENLTIEAFRYEIVKMIGKNIKDSNIIGYTPRALACLDRSYGISLKKGNDLVESEDIFLAILMDEESLPVKILKNKNLDIDILKSKIIGNNSGLINRKIKNESILEKFATDISLLAENKELDPVVGRDKEISRIIQILSRRTKNNPCLIGEAGVGKTSIIDGLAIKISDKDVPNSIVKKRIYSLNMGLLVAGTKYRGEFEERLTKIINEIIERNDTIIFIDEIHSIIGAGGSEGSIDASSILKPALSRGQIQLIGATTIKEYTKYIEKDSGFERRFQPIIVKEPTVEETINILFALRERYEEHHEVKISDEAIYSAVELSKRYIQERFFPDKAVDLMDEAASKIRMDNNIDYEKIKNLEKELFKIQANKNLAVKEIRFEDAALYRDKERVLIENIHEERQNIEGLKLTRLVVNSAHIEQIVSQWTGIPVVKLSKSDKERLVELETTIMKRIIGQDEAVKYISKSIKRARIGLSNPNRPLGTFIFLGASGVGKTELSKVLSESIFGDESSLVRFDMSEYMEKHSISKLIGSPPGYVGFEDEGLLSLRIRKKPYSVILFDEIEKAHVDIFNVLLQILDEGIFTDSKGRNVNFKNTVIIMTSNIGIDKINSKNVLGFLSDDLKDTYKKNKEILTGEIKKYFKPEFINRIDEIIVFNNLTKENLKVICYNQLENFKERLYKMNIEVTFSEEVINYIVEASYDNEYGARPLKRKITELLEDYVTEEILLQNIKSNDTIKFDLDIENKKIIY